MAEHHQQRWSFLFLAELVAVTKEPATAENIRVLKEAGYTITGVFGRFIGVEAPITTFISLETGLQTFDWIKNTLYFP